MQKRVLKVLAILLVLVMVIGSVPVSAAKKVTATSKKKVEKALKKTKAATVTFATEQDGTIVIHSQDGKENNKKLVINTPNADIVNYGSFKSVSIVACKSYKEKGEANTLYVKDEDAQIKICKDTAAKVVIQTEKANIIVNDNALVAIDCRTEGADVDVTVADGAMVGVEVKKAADVTVEPKDESVSAIVGVENKAEGTKLTTSMPTLLETYQDMEIVANKGSEGSIFDKANDAIDVNVDNKSEEPVFVTVGGELPSTNPDNASTAAITVEGIN